jgi:hypothetical protein
VLEVLLKTLKIHRFQFVKDVTGTKQGLIKPFTSEALSLIETYLNRISFFDGVTVNSPSCHM